MLVTLVSTEVSKQVPQKISKNMPQKSLNKYDRTSAKTCHRSPLLQPLQPPICKKAQELQALPIASQVAKRPEAQESQAIPIASKVAKQPESQESQALPIALQFPYCNLNNMLLNVSMFTVTLL